MARIRRLIGLASLVVFELASIVALHRLGRLGWLRIDWRDLAHWLETTTPEDAVAAAVRLVALAVGYWVTVTTIVYVLARLSRIPGAIRAIEWATLPAARKIVDGAVAVTLAASTIAGPGAPARAQDPVPVVIEAEDQGGSIPDIVSPDTPATTAPSGPSAVPLGPQRAGWTPSDAPTLENPPVEPAGPPALRSPTSTPDLHEVRKGDNLWTISAAHLELATGRRNIASSEIARYWRRVIVANEHSLRSGDPDLIHPGEHIELPPFDTEES